MTILVTYQQDFVTIVRKPYAYVATFFIVTISEVLLAILHEVPVREGK